MVVVASSVVAAQRVVAGIAVPVPEAEASGVAATVPTVDQAAHLGLEAMERHLVLAAMAHLQATLGKAEMHMVGSLALLPW